MDPTERRNFIQKTFDTVAGGYDKEALRFFQLAAEKIPEFINLTGNEKILDLACGTGHSTTILARLVQQGRVIGVDLSNSMLEQAKNKAVNAGLTNCEFMQMDMEQLQFANQSFDLANCAYGLFFVEDMVALVKHIASKVKPGGTVIACSFYGDAFLPYSDLFLDLIETYGVQRPALSWKRIGDHEKCYNVFHDAGLTEIQTSTVKITYYLRDAEQWWDIIWNAAFRGLVENLDQESSKRFKAEHLQKVQSLADDRGIHLLVESIFVQGIVPT